MRGGEGASGTDGAGTCDWRAVRVKGFNLAPLGWEEASGGAKLHSSQSPHRQCLWLPHLRLIKPTLSDEQASDFMSEMLRRRRWLRFRSESLGSPHICCPQRVKFSHHLPLEMVVGRVSTGWFIRLRTPHSSFFPPASATWLMERFSLITCWTKFRKGNRVEWGSSQEATQRRCWQFKRNKQQHNSTI